MTWKKSLWFIATILWFSVVVLWPVPTSLAERDGKETAIPVRIGLYNANLTKANFGISDAQFFEAHDGKKQWHIRAQFAELYRRENYLHLENVLSEFYATATGNIISSHSRYGRSYLDKHLVELEEDVSLQSKRGYLFTMEHLRYNTESDEFDSDDLVHMKGPSIDKPTMFLQGVGLHAEVNREHFILKKNVSAQRQLKTSQWLKVRANLGEFFTNDQRAAFVGRVHSSLPNLSIESEILEITVAEENESILARGKVTLKQKGRMGNAESVYLETGSNKILLKGRATVQTHNGLVKGSEITLFTDDDRLEVSEAEGKLKEWQ